MNTCLGGFKLLSLDEAKEMFEKTSETFKTRKNVSGHIYKQINADYNNCLIAQKMAEETKRIDDLSLFVWLVKQFTEEVDNIYEIEEFSHG